VIDRSKKLPAFFYQTSGGNEPVRDWILELSPEDRKIIGRVIFCVARGRMALLHGFIKKTQKTPGHDLQVALRRMKEVF